MTDYAACLAQLYARAPQPSADGLARTRVLLRALGDPQARVPSVVVAGTNGKGSTCKLIAEALRLAGNRVGLYTSPHLLSFTERVRVDDRPIDRHSVIETSADILRVVRAHDLTPTFFEITTALALSYFAKHSVDVAVLEVGLGGRLDATNAASKILTVLTPISYDHEALLGHTLEAIAAEKAAICTPGVGAVVAPQAPRASRVIEARLRQLDIDATYSGSGETGFAHLLPPYQRINFACAQAVCRRLHGHNNLLCPPEAFTQATAQFAWPGRYQWLWPKNLAVGALPCPVVLDGGHNEAGAAALQAAILADLNMVNRRIHIIFAALRGKNVAAMVAALAPHAATWRVCGLASKRRREPEALAIAIGRGATSFTDFRAAWQDVLRRPPEPEARILICGSLFLVADALALLTDADRDPPIDG